MLDVIRASALDGYAELVTELGGDAEPILAHAHLRPDLLGSTEAFIPFSSMATVIEQAARTLRCPDFSMRLASRQNLEILGPIALVARHSPTAREAMKGVAEHLRTYTPALRIDLQPNTGSTSQYTFDVLVPGLPSHVQVLQLGLGVSLGIFRLLMGSTARPLLVCVPHAKPEGPDGRELYERFFDSRVQFDSEIAGMVFADANLDRPRAGHDPQVRDYVAHFLEANRPSPDDIVSNVRHLIGRMLGTGHAAVPGVARHLGLHTRTLQRRLAKEGTTFESLLDDVRRERAEGYLTGSTVSFGHLAAMLGYAEQSCLSRSSVRWFGKSPSEVRCDGAPTRRSASLGT